MHLRMQRHSTSRSKQFLTSDAKRRIRACSCRRKWVSMLQDQPTSSQREPAHAREEGGTMMPESVMRFAGSTTNILSSRSQNRSDASSAPARRE